RIKQEWNLILECRKKGIPQSKYLKNGFVDINEKNLDTCGKTPQLKKRHVLSDGVNKEKNKFIFQLSGEQWTELPDSLKDQPYLKEWHVYNTLIQTIPAYIALFQDLRILELSKNQINHLPAEIGCLKNLKVLNVSFNNLKSVPPELGDCENLEKLDLSGNMEITELPFELSSPKMSRILCILVTLLCATKKKIPPFLFAKQKTHVDVYSWYQRLDELQTLLLQKNKLTYLPRALVNMPKLSLLVVSGDDLVEIPTAICESTTGLKFVSLKDSPVETIVCEDTEEIIESEREREQVEKEFMKAYIEDLRERESTPSYTTKVMLSLQL
ncbi:LRRC2 protein, partial [Bombycilla garrulus]|nr:LRRC2 protein [Bombycilla garrulus]